MFAFSFCPMCTCLHVNVLFQLCFFTAVSPSPYIIKNDSWTGVFLPRPPHRHERNINSTRVSLLLPTRILLVYSFTLCYAAGLAAMPHKHLITIQHHSFIHRRWVENTHTPLSPLASRMEKEMHQKWRHRRVTDRLWNKLARTHACAYTWRSCPCQSGGVVVSPAHTPPPFSFSCQKYC